MKMKAKTFYETVAKPCDKECPVIQFYESQTYTDVYMNDFITDIMISHAKRRGRYLPCMDECLKSRVIENEATKVMEGAGYA